VNEYASTANAKKPTAEKIAGSNSDHARMSLPGDLGGLRQYVNSRFCSILFPIPYLWRIAQLAIVPHECDALTAFWTMPLMNASAFFA
jgi:hypothetical protein